MGAIWRGHHFAHHLTLVEAVLRLVPRADFEKGEALVLAAARGSVAIVRLLLGWAHHAPSADCQRGEALLAAVDGGYVAVLRLLLEHPERAPLADCRGAGEVRR